MILLLLLKKPSLVNYHRLHELQICELLTRSSTVVKNDGGDLLAFGSLSDVQEYMTVVTTHIVAPNQKCYVKLAWVGNHWESGLNTCYPVCYPGFCTPHTCQRLGRKLNTWMPCVLTLEYMNP